MSLDRIRPVFDALHEEAPGAIWSRGVSLSRSANVHQQSDDGEEIVLTVTSPIAVLGRTVRIFTEDEDWMCDCTPREEICEHIVVGLIALKRAAESGGDLSESSDEYGTIGYRLVRAKGGLRLNRVVIAGGEETPLRGTVAAAAMKSGDGPRVVGSPLDLEVERVVGYHQLGWIPAPQMIALMKTLREAPVTLDGEPITMSTRQVGLRVRVTKRDDGYEVRAEHDPCITQLLNNGVAVCGDVLRPIGNSGLTGRELEELRNGKLYRGAEVSRLIGEVLPSLRQRIEVVEDGAGLPKATRIPPRLVVQTSRQGHELIVMPILVYGDPPIARVDGDRLTLLGDKRQVPVRDTAEEARLKGRVRRGLDVVVGHKERFDSEDAVAFAQRLRRWRGDVEGLGLDDFYLAPPLDVDVDPSRSGFDVRFNSPGHGQADAAGVMSAWQAGASLVPLSTGGWAPLPVDWLARYGRPIADLLAARDERGELPACMVPDLGRLCDDLDEPPPAELAGLRALIEGYDGIPRAPAPADLRATLRDYQQHGVDWLVFLREAGLGAMLADDMGLGKTLQALCAITGRTLVVAPTSVLHNWAAEIERFRPDLTHSIYHGPKRALDPNAQVTLTTYAIMRLDIDKLSAVGWDSVVLDEAQAIKNPDSQVARAAYRLKAGFRVTMTGTPVENRLDELWSQLNFTHRGLLGGRKDFQERYARPIADGEPGVAARLRQRIRPFVLRRLKREVATELPARTDLVLRCVLEPPERQVYEAIAAATREEVVKKLGAGTSVLQALEALLRLRQASCHTGLVPGREAETSSKVQLLMSALDTAVSEGHKALVFSQWTSMLDRIEPHLDTAQVPFIRLDGSTRDRGAVVNTFQSADGPPVMLLSLKAGGTGLNLTAADHVFLVDPWWNPAVEDQAADRAHRIGQDRPVFVHRLVAADTVEERILALQDRKRALAEAALGEGAQAGGLTRDDLLTLLA